ncbi:unnamed protein product [Ceratitis capitata]|uniref:(Mediterranean fruit fly) hypothetical protein n=1 Tax=Ceratitis capitata TaxID=7213 RepID=A0A811VG02_CERCA|nr:unnamed protein product [Ceratitis capitata]
MSATTTLAVAVGELKHMCGRAIGTITTTAVSCQKMHALSCLATLALSRKSTMNSLPSLCHRRLADDCCRLLAAHCAANFRAQNHQFNTSTTAPPEVTASAATTAAGNIEVPIKQ